MPREKTPEEQGGNRVGPGNPPKSTRFRPGKSGNPGGRPKGRSITAVVRELLDEALAGDKDTRPAVERVVDAALAACGGRRPGRAGRAPGQDGRRAREGGRGPGDGPRLGVHLSAPQRSG